MNAARRANGFSLIEVLIGMTIGLIGIVIIFQVFAVNDDFKRSTVSGSDSQVAGSLAIYAMEREARMAGFGFVALGLLGCQTTAYTSTRSPASYGFRMLPVEIHPGGANSDMLSINYGDPIEWVNGVGLSGGNLAPGAAFSVVNRSGIRFFDFLLVAQPAATPCSLINAVNLPLGINPITSATATTQCGGGNSTIVIETCSTIAKVDADGVSRYYNRAGGPVGAPTYTVNSSITANTRIFTLGAEPVFNVYAVRSNSLVVCDMRRSNCASTSADSNWSRVAENVVYMKAQYGMDTNDDGIVDTFDQRVCRDTAAYTEVLNDNFGDAWSTPTDSDADGLVDNYTPTIPSGYDFGRILAVRIAVVVRGDHYDRNDVSPATIKLWPDATNNSGCDGGAMGAAPSAGPVYTVPDRKYRYRVFETIVPLRNVLWMPTS